MPALLFGDDVDRRLNWSLGKSERLARRGKLPHVLLPDGTVRFQWRAIRKLIVSRPANGVEECLPTAADDIFGASSANGLLSGERAEHGGPGLAHAVRKRVQVLIDDARALGFMLATGDTLVGRVPPASDVKGGRRD